MYWLGPRRLFRFTAGTGIYVFVTLSEDLKPSLHQVSMTERAVQIHAHTRRHIVNSVHFTHAYGRNHV